MRDFGGPPTALATPRRQARIEYSSLGPLLIRILPRVELLNC
jgi:hypothetical protein